MLTYYKAMVEGKRYFVCGLPYQLAIKEGLLMREQVLDEMSEDDFDPIAWSMEMECLFFGESEKAFFRFEDLDKNRRIAKAIYPREIYALIKDKKFEYEPKKPGEIRLLCVDVAGMPGKQNDSSIYTIMRLLPTSKGYERAVPYMESMEGGHTVIQAIRIRQLFDDFDCDYLVLDTQNLGLGIYDQLTQPLFDKERNIEYEPWTCINDEKMAERCTYPNAPKVIYSIKGSQAFNSECAILLRDVLKRGKMKLLINEFEARDYLKEIKGYHSLPPEIKAQLEAPYVQITLLINEMINLESERTENNLIRLKETKMRRKDRYSSVAYGNFIASELERELLRSLNQNNDYNFFIFN